MDQVEKDIKLSAEKHLLVEDILKNLETEAKLEPKEDKEGPFKTETQETIKQETTVSNQPDKQAILDQLKDSYKFDNFK